jgi:hypothetical protein
MPHTPTVRSEPTESGHPGKGLSTADGTLSHTDCKSKGNDGPEASAHTLGTGSALYISRNSPCHRSIRGHIRPYRWSAITIVAAAPVANSLGRSAETRTSQLTVAHPPATSHAPKWLLRPVELASTPAARVHGWSRVQLHVPGQNEKETEVCVRAQNSARRKNRTRVTVPAWGDPANRAPGGIVLVDPGSEDIRPP